MSLKGFSQEQWKKFDLADLQSKRSATGKTYLPFLSESSFNMGIYELKAGAFDDQPIHQQDEIYYIVDGKGKLKAGDSLYNAEKGSIFFVRAEIEHRFLEIEENMSILVIFSKTTTNPGDPDSHSWNLDELNNGSNLDENSWNQFLFISSMRMGLYQLPRQLGGDKPLTHKVDEINIVTKGSATFTVADDQIPVEPGSIVWVLAGAPHSFMDLSEDFDVLITFQVKQ